MGGADTTRAPVGRTLKMRAKHLREWLWKHISVEAAAEADMETEGETSGP